MWFSKPEVYTFFFCTWPDTKYLKLCRPDGFHFNYLTDFTAQKQPKRMLYINRYGCVTISSIYKNRQVDRIWPMGCSLLTPCSDLPASCLFDGPTWGLAPGQTQTPYFFAVHLSSSTFQSPPFLFSHDHHHVSGILGLFFLRNPDWLYRKKVAPNKTWS